MTSGEDDRRREKRDPFRAGGEVEVVLVGGTVVVVAVSLCPKRGMLDDFMIEAGESGAKDEVWSLRRIRGWSLMMELKVEAARECDFGDGFISCTARWTADQSLPWKAGSGRMTSEGSPQP